MIELRWVESEVPSWDNKLREIRSSIVHVLQYRRLTNELEWTDWQDVPTVKEGQQ